MPWQECNQMDERLKFIARLPDGEKMAAVCRAAPKPGIQPRTTQMLS